MHLHSFVRLEKGSSSSPWPYRATLLRYCGTRNHFLTWELIILSIFSTLGSVRSYLVSGHVRQGSNPYYSHQFSNLPDAWICQWPPKLWWVPAQVHVPVQSSSALNRTIFPDFWSAFYMSIGIGSWWMKNLCWDSSRLDGLNFILAAVIFSRSFLRNFVQDTVVVMVVMSSMYHPDGW